MKSRKRWGEKEGTYDLIMREKLLFSHLTKGGGGEKEGVEREMCRKNVN